MCGIVGVCGKINQKEENIFKTLLCLDTIRGPDSTGVLGVSGSGGFEIYKNVGTPWNCFGEKDFEKIFKFTNVLLLGHNRWATVGTVVAKNAHPFDVGDIVGVHNGTIRQEYKLDDHKFFDVDSETVLHNFAKNGVQPTIEILEGAFAIVFYDKRDHTLHMLRNNERPLSFVYANDMKTMLFASEAWMLTIACARYGLEIGEIFTLPEMSEHSFKLPSQSKPWEVDVLPEITKQALRKKEVKSALIPWRPFREEKNKKSGAGHGKPVIRAVTQSNQLEHYKKLVSFVNKDVNFSVSGFVDGKHQKFIRAYAELPEADVIEIRIFMKDNNKKFKDLVALTTNNKIWTGHVKRISRVDTNRGYLLLDNRTIKPSDPRAISGTLIASKDKDFNVFKNRPVTIQEWLNATAIGCDNCGDVPPIGKAGELEWYDTDRFFCRECFNTQSVQHFLSVMPNGG